MHVIILAAGQSKRFQEAGYSIPKPFLEIDYRGRSVYMLQHVISTVPFEYRISVAVPPHHEFNIPRVKSYEIADTKGPAHTALQMISKFKTDSFLILDSDILNHTNDLHRISSYPGCGLGVLVSKSSNPAFSYVDKLGNFKRIEEKQRISEYAVRGAYFIASGAMKEFKKHLTQAVESMPEPYMSHAFNNYKQYVKVALETAYEPVDWGTPRDVMLSGAKIVDTREGLNVHNQRG
jgi:choline kinase